MSYQVLARKWRPRFFDEMVGQEHVLRALINALNEQRLHHAYLFTGTRGVGKTTIARILAKCLNCEEGISARPCGQCSSCREIAEGRFVDLIEVDAASRTRVEDTRELLDNVQYAPTRGRFKVYLIDEVHMLSTHSFNALLKTLEEPPAHVKFLLATTDPQKLPVTVLSRCLQFSLKNMTPESIVGYLETVLTAEQVSYEVPALWQLGRAAQGSMRDALSLTDQAIAFGEGSVQELQVTSMLGTMDRGRLFKLAEVMARASAAEILTEVAEMAEHAPDYDEVVQGLLGVWHRAALAQVVPDAIDNTQGDRAAILALAHAMNPEDLQLYYQVALTGRKDLALSPDPRQGFEMLVLRMLAFRPLPQASDALAALDLVTALEQQTSEKKKHLTSELAVASGVMARSAPAVAGEPVDDVVDASVELADFAKTVSLAVPGAESDTASHTEAPDAKTSDIKAPDSEVSPVETPAVTDLVVADVTAAAKQSVTERLEVKTAAEPDDDSEDQEDEYPLHEPSFDQDFPLPPPWLEDDMDSDLADSAVDPVVVNAPESVPAPVLPRDPAIASEPHIVNEPGVAGKTVSREQVAPSESASLLRRDSGIAQSSARPGGSLASLLDAPAQPARSPLAPDMSNASAATPMLVAASQVEPVSPEEELDGELPELAPHTWWQWVDRLGLAGLTLAIARNSALVSMADGVLAFDVDPQQGALFNASHTQKIEQVLQSQIPGCRVTLQLQVPKGETPEQRRQRRIAEAGYLAQQSIETDEHVRNILNNFNAVVLPDSIRPLN
jgi:DNA polymerase III subunit gamma/tau